MCRIRRVGGLKVALSSSDLTPFQSADGRDRVLQDKAIGCTNGGGGERRHAGEEEEEEARGHKRADLIITAADEVS